MAVFALTDAKVVINSVNLSSFVTKVTLDVEADELETTAMGAVYRARIGGLKNWSINLEMNQDFGASAPDVSLFSLLGTVVAVTAKSTTAINGATNPEYQGNVLVSHYTPLDGGVGDLAKTSFTWPGTGTLTRAVA